MNSHEITPEMLQIMLQFTIHASNCCPLWPAVGDWWEPLMGSSLFSVAFWVSTLFFFKSQKQRKQPEAAEKCWQQAAGRRTKCRPPRLHLPKCKTSNIVAGGRTAARRRGENPPLWSCELVSFQENFTHQWILSAGLYCDLLFQRNHFSEVIISIEHADVEDSPGEFGRW